MNIRLLITVIATMAPATLFCGDNSEQKVDTFLRETFNPIFTEGIVTGEIKITPSNIEMPDKFVLCMQKAVEIKNISSGNIEHYVTTKSNQEDQDQRYAAQCLLSIVNLERK